MYAEQWHRIGNVREAGGDRANTVLTSGSSPGRGDAAAGEGFTSPADLRPLLSDANVLLSISGRTSLSAVSYLEAMVESPTDQHLEAVGGLAPNLRELRLTRSCITNTRCLGTQLVNLSVLWLGRCHVADLGGLGALPALRELYAPFNEIRDLSPLARCELMDVLDLEGNRIGATSSEPGATRGDDDTDEQGGTCDAGRGDGDGGSDVSRRRSDRDAECLNVSIDACGLSFLHFCGGLTTLNLSNNPISDSRTSVGRRRYRRAVLEMVQTLEVLDDENVLDAERPRAAASDRGGGTSDSVAHDDTRDADRRGRGGALADENGDDDPGAEDDEEDRAYVVGTSMRKELALISDGIKYAQVGMDQVHSSTASAATSTSCLSPPLSPAASTMATAATAATAGRRPSSAWMNASRRPASAMASPTASSSQRKRPSTAHPRRPSTAAARAASSDMNAEEPVGLYWRKNQITSSVIDFATGGSGNGSGATDNDNSDLTRGADAEAICGNPVRGLRARKSETGDAVPKRGHAESAGADGREVGKLNLLEELRQWKIETAEMLEHSDVFSDDDGEVEELVPLSDDDGVDATPSGVDFHGDAGAGNLGEAASPATRARVGRRHTESNVESNILRIPSDVDESAHAIRPTMTPPQHEESQFPTPFPPLADINNKADMATLAPPQAFGSDDQRNLPVGRLRPKMREKMVKQQTGFGGFANTAVDTLW